MKNNKKLVALVCCMLMLVGAAGATLAWLTDQTQTVTNTFAPSDINIELTEKDTTKVDDNDYKEFKMIPGDTLAKDPVVTVKAGSEACWLFVKVKELGNATVINADGTTTNYTFKDYIDYSVITGENAWTKLEEGVYYRIVSASAQDQNFNVIQDADGNVNFVSVKDSVTKEMMDALENEGAVLPSLIFKAFAVQTANIDDVTDAWKAIPAEEKDF